MCGPGKPKGWSPLLLSLGSKENLGFFQGTGLRVTALHLEPSTAVSAMTAVIREVGKEFMSTQDHLTFGRYAGVSYDVYT